MRGARQDQVRLQSGNGRIRAGIANHIQKRFQIAEPLFIMCSLSLQLNIVLAVFNFLPIPPLDGWHALLGLVDPRTAYNLRQFEQYGFVLLLLIVLAGGRIIGDIVFTIERILLGL